MPQCALYSLAKTRCRGVRKYLIRSGSISEFAACKHLKFIKILWTKPVRCGTHFL